MTFSRVLWVIAFTVCAFLCSGAQPPHISQKHLDRMAAYWQHALALDDWEISVVAIKTSDMPDGSAGLGKWDNDLHRGTILVIRPEDYAKTPGLPKEQKAVERDIEDTVVHELVHLRIQEFAGADADHAKMAEEYTVVRLTNTLLRFHHVK